MRKLLIIALLLKSIYSQAEQPFNEKVSWLAGKLQECGMLSKIGELPPLSQIKQCLTQASSQETESNLFVFVSFSMPESAWLALSREVAENNGILILRGLPNNSFVELSERLIQLKEKGLAAHVQIVPKLFEEYDITNVPAFVLRGKKSFDKVTGNISLKHFLELVSQEGAND